MITPSNVRLADPADEIPLLGLLHDMYREVGFGRFDPTRALNAVRGGISRTGGIIGVIRGDDPATIEATIGLFIGVSWYSPDPYLFDLWSFVPEAYRRSTHAKSLIQFAKSAAIDLGLPLMMTVVTNEQTARKERLFERQLPRAGSIFIFNNAVHIDTEVAA